MKINAKIRDVVGKKVKLLRQAGMVPGSVYGPKLESKSIVVDAKELRKVFKAAGLTTFIDLEIEGEKKPQKVLIKDMYIHPIKDYVEDVSFYAIDEDRKLTVAVPVNLHGESPAVKANLGFMMQQLNTITVHCLPKDLPHSIEISIDSLEKPGDTISVGSIPLPEGVELDSSMEETSAVVYIAAPQKEEATETPVETAAATEGGEAAATTEAGAPTEAKAEEK